MEPATFKESTKVLSAPEGMKDCLPLHVFENRQGNYVISSWKLTWRERLSALFFGRTWVWVFGMNGTQPPIALSTMRTVFRKQK